MAADKPIGLGLIGCGAFGDFCLEAYGQMDSVRVVAVCDVVKAAADSFADKFSVPACYGPAELVARDDVDLVHIATPPSTHYELVMAAVGAGKHCLCEKPLAMNVTEADEMLAAAAGKGLIVPVNFVLRHNAVTDAVKAVIDSGVLGKVLSARLTNCAGDTKLAGDHWFWDKSLSGGIFIEHCVHFFDLYSHWLGAGEVIFANTELREGTTQEDRVMCEIRHESGAIASHYHGFDQVSLMDRTDHRMVCELGDIRVEGWIPLTAQIDAVVDDEGASALAACMPGCEIEALENYDDEFEVMGRGINRVVDKKIRISFTPEADKQGVYAQSAIQLLTDQIAFIRDAGHARRVTEANGRNALAIAQAAAQLAEK